MLSTGGDEVRLGIRAPRNIPVFRREICLENEQERVTACTAPESGIPEEPTP